MLQQNFEQWDKASSSGIQPELGEKRLARGDHFFVWRQQSGVPFQHHAIDLGDGTVVHFSDGSGGVAGPGSGVSDFEIQRTTMECVVRDGRDRIHVVSHPSPLEPERVVERALGQVGRRGYHLLFDNCEHFACWCVVGRDESRQVTVACERFGSMGVKAFVAGTARVTGRVGASRLVRGASPWMLVADAAQWITEAGGQHVGLRDPQRRKQAGRAVGMATAISVGACGGPAGMAVAGSLWAAGEMAGELSRLSYLRLRERRLDRDG